MQRRVALTQIAAFAVTFAVRSRMSAEETTHWGYEGATGPQNWPKEFPGCAGRSQSPIDIGTAKKVSGHPLEFHYEESRLRVVNNGHTVMVEYDEGSFITLDGARFRLNQFHFHRPGEERIKGRTYPFGCHLVHQSDDRQVAVVAVLFEEGPAHPLIDTVWAHLPTTVGQKFTAPDIKINAQQLLPTSHTSYRYSGSLTTPPCTEGVAWHVLTTPGRLSTKQLAAFPFKMNARPLQELNGRLVEED